MNEEDNKIVDRLFSERVKSKGHRKLYSIVIERFRKKHNINRDGFFTIRGYASFNTMNRWVNSIDWNIKKQKS